MITNLNIGYTGRLGNQLFQYAMLLAIADKTGYNVKIPYKNSIEIQEKGCYDLYTNKWIQYKFLLNECFSIPINWMDESEINEIKYFEKEKNFAFDMNVFNVKDYTDFNGYYQSYKYFQDIMPLIHSQFVFKENIYNIAKNIYDSVSNSMETIGIHVRRGDYLGIQDILPVCEAEYYEQALTHFADKEYFYIICSDDIEWCKESFGMDKNIFYSENNQYVDMCLLSLCNNNIMPNSTFSYWASMLNKNENKTIISPIKWFGNNINTDDLIPSTWIRI